LEKRELHIGVLAAFMVADGIKSGGKKSLD
jgi:hypothetical protein